MPKLHYRPRFSPTNSPNEPLSGLTDLQKVPIRIPEKATNLSSPVNRRCQEDGPTRLERLIGGLAVRYPDRQLATDGIGIRGRRKGNCGLVPGGPTTGHQQQPAPLKLSTQDVPPYSR